MRNLKRALSLTLASVMLLGMMVIGTSAASFTDADDISNVTAATILQDLEIMQGSDGKFSPKQTVTRGQMAILICKIMFGNRLNVDTLAQEQKFDDCPAGQYYTGYVNFAAEQGFISGYGNGKFGPGDPVSTAQAALMLCRALGYYQGGELEGKTWGENALNATTLATKLKLFGSLKLDTNAGLSRDNVAEMVFNTMTKAVPVMYNDTWKVYYTDSDELLGGTKFNYLNTWAYQNYDLVYKNVVDDLGNMNTRWGIGKAGDTDAKGNLNDGSVVIAEYNKIVDEENEAILTYTTKKTDKASDIARDLRGYNAGDVDVYINGKVTANQNLTNGSVIAAQTGDGYVVKIYANDSGVITAASVVKEQLVKVISVNAAKKEITLQTTAGNKVIKEADSFYSKISGCEANDYILAVIDSDNKVNDAYVGKSVTGVVSSYTDKGAQTVDSTQYKASSCGFISDSALKAPDEYKNTTDECTLYLDSTGRIIAIDSSAKISGEQVCFVAYARSGDNWNSYREAYVYLPDGTKGVYRISTYNNSSKSSEIAKVGTGLYVYSLNDNRISLKSAAALEANDYQIAVSDASVSMDKDTAKYSFGTPGDVYMNSATKFYMHDTIKASTIDENNAKDAVTASTGLASIKTHTFSSGDLTVAYRTVNGNKIAIAVYGKAAGSVSAASSELVFIAKNTWTSSDNEWYKTTAIFTGKDPEEITIKGKPAIGLYTYKEDSQGRFELEAAETCAYNGSLVKIEDDKVYVGGVQLNGLDKDNVLVYDNTGDDPVKTGKSYLDTKGSFQGYAVVDNDIVTARNVLAVYINSNIPAVVQTWNKTGALNTEATVAGGSGTSADPFLLVLKAGKTNLSSLASMPSDTDYTYTKYWRDNAGDNGGADTAVGSLAINDKFYISDATKSSAAPKVYYKLVNSKAVTISAIANTNYETSGIKFDYMGVKDQVIASGDLVPVGAVIKLDVKGDGVKLTDTTNSKYWTGTGWSTDSAAQRDVKVDSTVTMPDGALTIAAGSPVTRTVTAPSAKTDSSITTTITADSATKADGASGVVYTVALTGTATKTMKYDITLAGLSSVSVANDTSAPTNWQYVKVSDTKITVYVTSTAAASGAIKISGTVNNNVTAAIGDGVQTYKMNNVAEAAVDSGALKVKVEADKAWAVVGETVTYTVTVSGNAGAAGASDEITIAGLTNLTGASALADDADTPTATNCTISGLVIAITANSTATSGTFTVSGVATTNNITPTVGYDAK